MRQRWQRLVAVAAVLVVLAALGSRPLLTGLGQLLVAGEDPVRADAAVVLNGGPEIFARLIAAAMLFRQDRVGQVVINGNRKTDVMRRLERQGLVPCCPWYETAVRVLALHGVPRERIWAVSAEDAYDTVTEARAVGRALAETGVKRVIVVTSRYHSRRAGWVWRRLCQGRIDAAMFAAPDDPFDPAHWWHDGRQIRWLMAEYGAVIYDGWKLRKDGKEDDGGGDGPACRWRTGAAGLRIWDCEEMPLSRY